MPIFEERQSKEAPWYKTRPGEHYRLLATLVQLLQPKIVVEVGTFTGMGTLALTQDLLPTGRLITFDLAPWDSFRDTWFNQNDFYSGQMQQELFDVSTDIESYRNLFENTDLLFIDGPKDGFTEAKILLQLEKLRLPDGIIVVFDDIRLMNMVNVWRSILRPKLDVTCFGHWSGTGLVDWNASFGFS